MGVLGWVVEDTLGQIVRAGGCWYAGYRWRSWQPPVGYCRRGPSLSTKAKLGYRFWRGRQSLWAAAISPF